MNNIIKEKKSITDQVINQGSAIKLNGDHNNCTVLSLAAATNMSYDRAYIVAEKIWSRKIKKGVKTKEISNFFNTNSILVNDIDQKFIGKRVEVKSAYLYKKTGKVNFCQMSLSTFAKQYSKGVYYILVRSHALVIKDGEIVDHKSLILKNKRRVLNAWKIEEIK